LPDGCPSYGLQSSLQRHRGTLHSQCRHSAESAAQRRGWVLHDICADGALPMPSRAAICALRSLERMASALLCEPVGLDASCQRMISSWRTTRPSGCERPWQVVPPHEATPRWVVSFGNAAVAFSALLPRPANNANTASDTQSSAAPTCLYRLFSP
jgi:hypothetical protein